jgi:hypothetical protein
LAEEDDVREFPKNVQNIIVSLAVILWIVYFVFLIGAFGFDARWKELFEKHMGAGIAIPLAGLSAFVLVSVLEIQSGPVQFEGLGIKLKGAAGPVVFWVICFLAIIVGIRVVP